MALLTITERHLLSTTAILLSGAGYAIHRGHITRTHLRFLQIQPSCYKRGPITGASPSKQYAPSPTPTPHSPFGHPDPDFDAPGIASLPSHELFPTAPAAAPSNPSGNSPRTAPACKSHVLRSGRYKRNLHYRLEQCLQWCRGLQSGRRGTAAGARELGGADILGAGAQEPGDGIWIRDIAKRIDAGEEEDAGGEDDEEREDE